jgi:D-sedoheptulose 7-phosphate isomerase
MKPWIENYLKAQHAAIDSIPVESVSRLIEVFRKAWQEDRQIFVFGNGGSATNASHFATDLGKGASDKLGKPFRIMSLNDNTSWITALGNDYSYEDIFVRQLMNYARPGDIAFTMSVSGNSPNVVKAMQWSKDKGLVTIAMVGQKQGKLAGIADHVLVVEDGHYGRAEDTHMTMSHLLCYAFIEQNEAS